MTFLMQVLRISGPYGLAALAGTFSELGGMINIALEGILLSGALGATLAAHWTGSPWLGVLAGIFAGMLLACLHAWASLCCRVDQIISSLACNFLAAGLCRFILKLVFNSTSNSARIDGLSPWGPCDPFIVLFFVIAGLCHWAVYRTRFGLRLRAVGENPKAAESLGVAVRAIRFKGVLISGALAGLGGAWLALEQRQFTDGMSGGRGYIALAAVILGRWTPLGAVGAAIFFGLAESLQIILQAYGVKIPTQFVQMIPYLMTLAAVAGIAGKSRPPAANGIPYPSEKRGL